jgi:hypothetical protein
VIPLVEEMLQAIGALPPERFAVVDGAYYADLPAALHGRGLDGRSLYTRGSDVDDVRGGPFLVAVPTYAAAQSLLDIIGDHSTGVFWSAPLGGAKLYEHLRRINAVQIARVDTPAAEDDYQTVLFRHGDPVVLGSMIAVMDPAQKAELLGASPAIVYGGRKWGQVSMLRAGE